MKKLFVFFAALVLALSCTQPDPIRDAMEKYAKENCENPGTYKFEYMGIVREYTYLADLMQYQDGIEKLAAKAADKAPYEAELEKVQGLLDEYGIEVGCREYSLYFYTLGGSSGKMRLPGVVLARYDADGKLMMMTMDPDSLPTYPALQILKDRGEL